MILRGDARHIPLADESVNCVVTSPPYWGLRSYGGMEMVTLFGTWDHFEIRRKHQAHQTVQRLLWRASKTGLSCRYKCCWLGALGLEPTPELYVEHIVEVFREVRRVLRKDGTCWVNMGDSYCAGTSADRQLGTLDFGVGTVAARQLRRNGDCGGLKPKDLCGIPWRVAFALQADGWWLRSDIIWAKPNPMPESVTDRPTKAHEYIFLLTKSERYYFDAEAVREPVNGTAHKRQPLSGAAPSMAFKMQEPGQRNRNNSSFQSYMKDLPPENGRNIRSVWTMATQPFPDAHFATFPEELAKRCILAGCPSQVCAKCGAPWERVTEPDEQTKAAQAAARNGQDWYARSFDNAAKRERAKTGSKAEHGYVSRYVTLGFQATCSCNADTKPGTVLDPFCGSGTTVKAAKDCGRRGIGLDLKPDYLAMAQRRTAQEGLGI